MSDTTFRRDDPPVPWTPIDYAHPMTKEETYEGWLCSEQWALNSATLHGWNEEFLERTR